MLYKNFHFFYYMAFFHPLQLLVSCFLPLYTNVITYYVPIEKKKNILINVDDKITMS